MAMEPMWVYTRTVQQLIDELNRCSERINDPTKRPVGEKWREEMENREYLSGAIIAHDERREPPFEEDTFVFARADMGESHLVLKEQRTPRTAIHKDKEYKIRKVLYKNEKGWLLALEGVDGWYPAGAFRLLPLIPIWIKVVAAGVFLAGLAILAKLFYG